MKIFQIFLFVTLLASNYGARILGIFHYPAKSHFIFNGAILKSLADAGHEITVITTFPEDITFENYTVIDTSTLFDIQVGNTTFDAFTDISTLSVLRLGFGHEVPVCYKFWELKEVQDIMNSQEKLFDVVLVEIFHLYKCYQPIALKMNIPIIGTMTFKSWIPADRTLSNPNNPATIPFDLGKRWECNNFYVRLMNFLDHLEVHFYWYFVTLPFLEKFHQDHLQNMIPYSVFINAEPSLIFYNTHHTYFGRPKNPNVIEVAGIQVRPATPLPQNIEKFISEATEGVILFTFGSLVRASSLPPHILMAFLDAFAQIPQRIIMKYEKPLDNIPENVMILKWLPQRDILEHKNTKAFISHCGQGGMYEAIYTATPIVSCPLMFDQPTNAAILENLGVAVRLDMKSISKEKVLMALHAVINDTRYQENMQKLSIHFKDRPLTPQQSVVYWTEYVLKHNGAPHMKNPASDLNWFQYLLLDVISFIILVAFISIILLYYILKLVIHFLRNLKFIKNKSI